MMNETYSIGFDIGGTNIACGLLDGEYGITEKQSRPFKPLGEDGIADTLLEMARETCQKRGVPFESIGSVGVCIPGSVDVKKGVVIDAYNLSLHDSPFRAAAERRFNKKTALLNDADAAALAVKFPFHEVGSPGHVLLRHAQHLGNASAGHRLAGGKEDRLHCRHNFAFFHTQYIRSFGSYYSGMDCRISSGSPPQ